MSGACPGHFDGDPGALAGTPDYGYHSDPGLGVHALLETPGDGLGGARCLYFNGYLVGIRTRFPLLYARDRSREVDQQVVGYRTVIQYSDTGSGGPFTTLAGSASSVRKATTSDRHIAHLAGRTYMFEDGVALSHTWWRVLVRMYWYKPGTSSTVVGRADHAPTWFEDVAPFQGAADSCHNGD